MASPNVAGAAALIDALADLAWPGLFIAVLVLYRDKLGTLIDRLRSASPSGLGFAEPSQADPTAPKDASFGRDGTNESETATQSGNGSEQLHPVVEELRDHIRQQLNSLQVTSPAERENMLTIEVAKAQLREQFERTYSAIFGSQLLALRKLADVDSIGSLEEYHREHIQRTGNPNLAIPYNDWVQFLLNASLIKFSNSNIQITQRGKAFLQYLLETNRSFTKAF